MVLLLKCILKHLFPKGTRDLSQSSQRTHSDRGRDVCTIMGEILSAIMTVPMVASFLGCRFGGFLYDISVYIGPESHIINTPVLGLTRVSQPHDLMRPKEKSAVEVSDVPMISMPTR